MTDTQNEEYISEQEIMQNILRLRQMTPWREISPRLYTIVIDAVVFAQDPCFPAKERMRKLTHAMLEIKKERSE